MRSALLALVGLAGACGSHPHHQTTCRATAPVRMEVLLNEQLAASSGIGALDPTFDVSPQRLLLISDADRMYLLGWGGLFPVEGMPGSLGSFAYTPDGLLLAVRDAELDYLGTSGQLETLFTLPHEGMAVAPGGTGTMYLFDRQTTDGNYGLYQLAAGRKVLRLFDSPKPIDAVARAGDHLFVATGGGVFDATPGAPSKLIAYLGSEAIGSIAASEDGTRVYFSDGASVFAVTGGCVDLVTRELGGTLRVMDGALLVLDAKHRLLVRFATLP